MPATSAKQKRFMDAAANNPAFAKKVGVPVKVAKEYSQASKGQTFKKGGVMKHSDMSMDKKVVKKAVGMHDKQQHGGKKTDMAKLKKGGMPMVMKDGKKVPAFAAKSGGMTKMARGGGVETKGKTKGTMIKMKSGGKTC
jgi:hypothetical protein